jgi:Domain of unknown function (DUF1707)/Domain of unknown function (DUF4190)
VPYEPSKPDLRASDSDREAAVERIRVAGMEGRLDSEELEQRIATAYAARWCSELDSLTLDVTPPTARLAPAPLVFERPARRVNGLAVASLVVALLWMGWLGSLAGVIMGHVALSQIARSGGTQSGRPVALAGAAIGYFGLTTLLAILLLTL